MTNTKHQQKIINIGSEELPDIPAEEIKLTLKQSKPNRAPGEDRIITGMLKIGTEKPLKLFTKLLTNVCLQAEYHTNWKFNSSIIR